MQNTGSHILTIPSTTLFSSGMPTGTPNVTNNTPSTTDGPVFGSGTAPGAPSQNPSPLGGTSVFNPNNVAPMKGSANQTSNVPQGGFTVQASFGSGNPGIQQGDASNPRKIIRTVQSSPSTTLGTNPATLKVVVNGTPSKITQTPTINNTAMDGGSVFGTNSPSNGTSLFTNNKENNTNPSLINSGHTNMPIFTGNVPIKTSTFLPQSPSDDGGSVFAALNASGSIAPTKATITQPTPSVKTISQPVKVTVSPSKGTLQPVKVSTSAAKVTITPSKVTVTPTKVTATPTKVTVPGGKVTIQPTKTIGQPVKVVVPPAKATTPQVTLKPKVVIPTKNTTNAPVKNTINASVKTTAGPTLPKRVFKLSGIAPEVTTEGEEVEDATQIRRRGKVINLSNIKSPPINTNANKNQSEDGWLNIPVTMRTDGTQRKPMKVRAGWTPSEDRSKSSLSVTPSSVTTVNEEDNEEDEVDILSEGDNDDDDDIDEKISSPPPSESTSSTLKRPRPNQNFLSRVINSTNLYNTKILPALLEREEEKLEEDRESPPMKRTKRITEEEDEEAEEEVEEEEDSEADDFKETIQKTSKSILKQIDKFRRIEGAILLKQIAKRYGLKIEILGPDANDDYEEDEEEEDNRPQKKFKSIATKSKTKRPPVRLKRVTGAIGYKSAMNGH